MENDISVDKELFVGSEEELKQYLCVSCNKIKSQLKKCKYLKCNSHFCLKCLSNFNTELCNNCKKKNLKRSKLILMILN